MENTTKVTLTDRPPVRINKDTWPILAEAKEHEHDGQVRCQANRESWWRLIVRQHADGRTLVYGIHGYSSNWQGESGRDIRGGRYYDTTPDLPHAIRTVAEELEAQCVEEGGEGVFPRLVRECVGHLPAVDLD